MLTYKYMYINLLRCNSHEKAQSGVIVNIGVLRNVNVYLQNCVKLIVIISLKEFTHVLFLIALHGDLLIRVQISVSCLYCITGLSGRFAPSKCHYQSHVYIVLPINPRDKHLQSVTHVCIVLPVLGDLRVKNITITSISLMSTLSHQPLLKIPNQRKNI